MSWQDWCKNIEAGGSVAGGIYGKDDSSVWGQFGEDGPLKFNPAELVNITTCMQKSNPSAAAVHVNGVKQTLIKADDDVVMGKKGTDSSIVAIKCNQCIVVGVGGSGSEPRSLFNSLSTVAELLKGSGY